MWLHTVLEFSDTETEWQYAVVAWKQQTQLVCDSYLVKKT